MLQSLLSFVVNFAFLLLLWRAVQRDPRGDFTFNPLLSTPNRWLDRFLGFLAPVFPGAPPRVVPIATLVFLLLFRGALLYSTRRMDPSFAGGTIFYDKPSLNWPPAVLDSFLGFAVFATRFWNFAFLVDLLAGPRAEGRVPEAIRDLARPTSLLALPWRVLVLVGATAAVCFGLNSGTTSAHLLPVTLLSLVGTLDILRIAIVAAWFVQILALILQNRFIALLASEFQDTLLGRFSSRRLILGAIDFTPLVAIFALSLAYRLLAGLILHFLA